MGLSRDKLVNITVFMRFAAEAGSLKTVNDIMAFAETLQNVQKEIKALEAPKPAAEGDTP